MTDHTPDIGRMSNEELADWLATDEAVDHLLAKATVLDGDVLTGIRQAHLARDRAEKELIESVAVARRNHLSWQAIGEQLGTSKQQAQQYFGRRIDA
ncbi:hypothetical protein [Agilicoccus flavus]|uniref:hypothetical protein n=1 Tax=Agilicoccus flavus TaxID=2775968 RepID=UPI001CF711B7|nr:hypothetical protein [Agilicoccus flavus]